MNISPNMQAMQVIDLSRRIGANNVANLNSRKFQGSGLAVETGPGGTGVRLQGVDLSSTRGPMFPAIEDEAGQNWMSPTAWGLVEGSNTELITEMVNSIRDTHFLRANVAVTRAWDDLTGTVLELRA